MEARRQAEGGSGVALGVPSREWRRVGGLKEKQTIT